MTDLLLSAGLGIACAATATALGLCVQLATDRECGPRIQAKAALMAVACLGGLLAVVVTLLERIL
jgi:hypothetical protein